MVHCRWERNEAWGYVKRCCADSSLQLAEICTGEGFFRDRCRAQLALKAFHTPEVLTYINLLERVLKCAMHGRVFQDGAAATLYNLCLRWRLQQKAPHKF